MPSQQVVTVELDRAAYQPGQLVQGSVRLHLDRPCHLDSYQLRFSGIVTCAVQRKGVLADDVKILRNRLIDRLPVDLRGFAAGNLSAGEYEYPFSFELPLASGFYADYPTIGFTAEGTLDNAVNTFGSQQRWSVRPYEVEATVVYSLAVGFFSRATAVAPSVPYKPSVAEQERIESMRGEWDTIETGSAAAAVRDPLFCGSAELNIGGSEDLSRTHICSVAPGFDSVSTKRPSGCFCSPSLSDTVVFNLRIGPVADLHKTRAVRADLHIDNTLSGEPVSGTVRLLRRVTLTDPDGPPLQIVAELHSSSFGPVKSFKQSTLPFDIPILDGPLPSFSYNGERGPHPCEILDASGVRSAGRGGTFTIACEYYLEARGEGLEDAARVQISGRKKGFFI